ncbi:MAG TPA: hypothetical protein PLH55_08330 [Spirochaetales bacterium]|nr:hypothetical protein [Spirochaetales bacterium]
MNRRWVVAAMAIALVSGMAAAADEPGDSVYGRWPSSLGYSLNVVSGAGLSWQRWYGPIGVAVTAGGVYNEDTVNATSTFDYTTVVLDYNAQLRLSRMLFAAEYSSALSTNLQAVALLAHRGYIACEETGYDPETYETIYERLPFAAEFMVGTGVAVELTYFEHLSQTVDFLYAASWPPELSIAAGWSMRYRY